MDSSSVQKTIRDFLGCIAERIAYTVSGTRTLGMTRESKERGVTPRTTTTKPTIDLVCSPYDFHMFLRESRVETATHTHHHQRSIMCVNQRTVSGSTRATRGTGILSLVCQPCRTAGWLAPRTSLGHRMLSINLLRRVFESIVGYNPSTQILRTDKTTTTSSLRGQGGRREEGRESRIFFN